MWPVMLSSFIAMSQSSTRSPASSAIELVATPITTLPTDARPSRTPHFVSVVGLWSVMRKVLRCVAAGSVMAPSCTHDRAKDEDDGEPRPESERQEGVFVSA